MRWLLFILASLALPAGAQQRYAVVIGHNESPNPDRATLRYADDDAARFYELLAPIADKAFLLTRFDAESQAAFPELIKLAEPPTEARLERVVTQLRASLAADAKAGRKSTVYFVYAGHGDSDDGHGYVTLADGRFTRSELREAFLTGVRGDQVHVIVDACKSYYLVAGRGPGGRRKAVTRPFAGPTITNGVGYILSTSSDADSHEWAAVRGGVFSLEVRSALLGAADMNVDGTVDYEELAAFVAVANEGIGLAQFRPDVYIRAPGNNRRAAVLTPPGERKILLAAEASGRLSVTDPRGLRYADTHKGPGAPLALSLLHSGRYGVEWRDQWYEIEPGQTPIQLADLTPRPTQVAARSDGDHAFQQLFSQPLQPAVLRGFRLASAAPPEVVAIASPTPRWVAPTLAAAGVVAAGLGVGLHLAANDEFHAADTGPQIDIRGHESQGNAYAYGAAGAYAIATGALVAATWVWLSQD